MTTLDLVFDWLLQGSLRASLITVAVLLIQRMLRRQLSAHWQYALWLPVLIVLLMPALVESQWSAESFIIVPEPTRLVLPDMPVQSIPVSATPVGIVPEPAIQLGWHHVWVFGALGLLITGLVSFALTLRRFRKGACDADAALHSDIARLASEIGLSRLPRVWISSTISSPAVAGLFRPVLLLPAGFREAFSSREAQLVLKHELMHLKRGDLLMNALLCLLMALHWFNPLLWLAFYKARIDREAACDEDVLRHDSPGERAEYGHALLKAQSAFCPRGWSLGFVGIFERGAGLRARIESIAEARHTPGSMAVITLGIILVMTFLGTTRAQVAGAKQTEEQFVSLEIMIADLSGQAGDFSGKIQKMLESREHSQVLSAADEKELRKQIAKSQDSKIISYPRVLTRLGQEASIRSVVNQPVPDEKQKSGISHLPIGLTFNLMPTKSGDKMRLKYDLTDSRMIGEEQTPKGPMPIVKSYHNQSSVELEEGFALVLWSQEERRLYTVRYGLVSDTEKLSANGLALINDAETKAKELRRAAPQRYDFVRAHLGDVLRYLATDAEIRFISLSDDEPLSRKAVTFSLRSSPFGVLETICRAHGLTLHFEQDVWHIRAASGNEATVPQNKPERGSEFTIGQSMFRPGDSIRITEVQRVGQSINVTAYYELASADTANISLHITSTKDSGVSKTDPRQLKAITKGKGRVVLHHPDAQEGLPHVSFYPTSGGKSFGGIFFGTAEEAAESRKLRLNQKASATKSSGSNTAITLNFPDVPVETVISIYAKLTGKKVGVDPAAKDNRVKIVAPKPLPLQEATAFIEASLLLNGFALVADGPDHLILRKSTKQQPSAMTAKLQSIVLPQVQFSEATLEEAIEFFRVKSRALDTSEPEVSKRGVNIVLKDSFAGKITLDLKEVPLMEALKYTASLAGLELQIGDNAVILHKRSDSTTTKPERAAQGKAVELAKKYILPQVNFSAVSTDEALEFLRRRVQGSDDAEQPADINLILKPGGDPKTQITLDLKDVSLWEAVRYVAELSNHSVSADDHSIILTPR